MHIHHTLVLSSTATAVYMYDSTNNSWDIISYIATSCYDCFIATLPDNQLMVMGGLRGDGVWLNDVQLASVCN